MDHLAWDVLKETSSVLLDRSFHIFNFLCYVNHCDDFVVVELLTRDSWCFCNWGFVVSGVQILNVVKHLWLEFEISLYDTEIVCNKPYNRSQKASVQISLYTRKYGNISKIVTTNSLFSHVLKAQQHTKCLCHSSL